MFMEFLTYYRNYTACSSSLSLASLYICLYICLYRNIKSNFINRLYQCVRYNHPFVVVGGNTFLMNVRVVVAWICRQLLPSKDFGLTHDNILVRLYRMIEYQLTHLLFQNFRWDR
jgi:hypothetical protein